MKLDQFILKKNRQRPDLMYQYELKKDILKFQITTMNSGKSFLATIESKRLDGRYYQEFSKNEIPNEILCLSAFEIYLDKSE